jgi:O-antigen/teichoic acid export membrane protein
MPSIKKNFAYQTAYQLLKMVLPLVTAPYIARVLGKVNVGIYSYTYTIAHYFVVFSMLGLEQYGSRAIAKCRDNPRERSRVFSELLWLHCAFSLFVTVVYGVVAFYSPREYTPFMLIQTLFVLSAVLDVNWFFFGIENFQVTVVRNTVIKLLTVVAIFALVRTRNDLGKYVGITSVGVFMSQLALWFYLPSQVHFSKVSWQACLKHLKPLLLLFSAVVAAHVYRAIDKLMLGWFGRIGDLGCYEYADKLIRMPLSVITALDMVMLSRMSHLVSKSDSARTEKLLDLSSLGILVLSFAMAFGLAGIAPEFVVLFLGEEYTEGILLLSLLAISLPLIAWNNFVRTQILIPRQQDTAYTAAVWGGAIANVVANIPLIYFYSARGAAVSTIFSYGVVMFIQMKAVSSHVESSRFLKVLPFPLAIGTVMFGSIRLIGGCLGVSVYGVALEILVGGAVYAILTLVYFRFKRPDIYKDMIRMIGNGRRARA